MICEYGCGLKAKHQFKNGKWCCDDNHRRCPAQKKLVSEFHKDKIIPKHVRIKMGESRRGKTYEEFFGIEAAIKLKRNQSLQRKGCKSSFEGKKHSDKSKKKMSKSQCKRREGWIEKYHLFCKVEEYIEQPKTGKIQVHCKNHKCKNSKENRGWFTPTHIQLHERIRQLESENGNGGSYLYCSEKCKKECELYDVRSDPFKDNILPYTHEEYQTFRQEVLRRDSNKCIYCDKPATDVHHTRPVKLEPFFALDPDYTISCCEKCHRKYGHKTGTYCSTGQLANRICE